LHFLAAAVGIPDIQNRLMAAGFLLFLEFRIRRMQARTKHSEFVLCPVCYEHFRLDLKPCVLSCGHSICYSCVRKLRVEADHIHCPICTIETHVPIGVDKLPTNFPLLAAAEQLRSTERDKSNGFLDVSSVLCQFHSKGITGFCNVCKHAICASCCFQECSLHSKIEIAAFVKGLEEQLARLQDAKTEILGNGALQEQRISSARDFVQQRADVIAADLMKELHTHVEDQTAELAAKVAKIERNLQFIRDDLQCHSAIDQNSVAAIRLNTVINEPQVLCSPSKSVAFEPACSLQQDAIGRIACKKSSTDMKQGEGVGIPSAPPRKKARLNGPSEKVTLLFKTIVQNFDAI